MTSSLRNKGNRIRQKAIKHYQDDGWLVDVVEKTARWVVEKDLYGLFDIICIKKNIVCLVQVKTNRPPTQKHYMEFYEKYGGPNLLIQSYTWYDNQGPIIMTYYTDSIDKNDLRKQRGIK